jgi:hypothetical protein
MTRFLKAGALVVAGILIGLIIQFGVNAALAQTPTTPFSPVRQMLNGGMGGHMAGPMTHMGGSMAHMEGSMAHMEGSMAHMGGSMAHMGGQRGHMGQQGIMDRDAMHAKMAEALGISVEELDAAIAAGKTPYQLAEELEVDFAAVQEAMTAAHAEAVAQAVADGTITQAQADQMLAHHAQMGGHKMGADGMGAHGMGAHGMGANEMGAHGMGGQDCPLKAPVEGDSQ